MSLSNPKLSQASPAVGRVGERRCLPSVRWWIAGLLFVSTAINYIDRQTLSALAPFLKADYHWTNEDYALIVIAFRVAYSLGQAVLGRFVDRVGTRTGLTVTVTWYSAIAMLTATAALFTSPSGALAAFILFRFLLGLGESPNWPAATKAVSEWFPKKERGWAVALFDSGSSIGAAVAPAMVVGIYLGLDRRWWPVFIVTGILGFVWLFFWRRFYHPPETHPRITPAEKALILAERDAAAEATVAAASRTSWLDLIKLRQTWGVVAARAFSDPVWYFIADWFMLFLVQEKHFDPKNALLAVWMPFIAADLGNFAGGGFSSWLIHRGWSVERARKVVVIFGGLGMSLLIPAIYATNLFVVAALFAVATFAYACFCTMALVLPSDLFKSDSVASVSGISGTAAGLVTVVATYFIGEITTHYSFKPILVAGSILPLLGVFLVLSLVRDPRTADERRILKRISSPQDGGGPLSRSTTS